MLGNFFLLHTKSAKITDLDFAFGFVLLCEAKANGAKACSSGEINLSPSQFPFGWRTRFA